MQRQYLACPFIVLAITGIVNAVNVSVYYESLCPDSTRFIALQLYPNYFKLKNHINVEFIPYGKAIHNFVNNTWKFECQHGNNECTGNKLQSCALYQNSSEEQDLKFVNCVMRQRNPAHLKGVEDCANKVGFNWNEIKHCAQSDFGDRLLAENGDKTNKLEPSISFVPTIIYNHIYDDYLQETSLTHFLATVCSLLKDEEKPETCRNGNNTKLPKKNAFFDFLY